MWINWKDQKNLKTDPYGKPVKDRGRITSQWGRMGLPLGTFGYLHGETVKLGP